MISGGSQWTPHTPVIEAMDSKVYVSEFRSEDKVVWLMVNRNKLYGETVKLNLHGLQAGFDTSPEWFDVYHGKKLNVTCRYRSDFFRMRLSKQLKGPNSTQEIRNPKRKPLKLKQKNSVFKHFGMQNFEGMLCNSALFTSK